MNGMALRGLEDWPWATFEGLSLTSRGIQILTDPVIHSSQESTSGTVNTKPQKDVGYQPFWKDRRIDFLGVAT